jgi:hypothetical protein
VEIPRQGQHQGDLHQLRGLELDKPDIEPALRPQPDATLEFHRDKKDQRHAVEDIGDAKPESDVDHGDAEQKGHAHAKSHDLARSPRLPAASRGRVKHREPDRCRDGHRE